MMDEKNKKWDWRKQQMAVSRIEKIEIIEYTQMYLCVGGNSEESRFWFMKIYKNSNPFEMDITLTEASLSLEEKNETLDMLRGSGTSGGVENSDSRRIHFVRSLIHCYGIVGFVRFIGPYYIIVITKRSRVATIGPCDIYKIDGVEMIPLGPLPKDVNNAALEDKYKKLFLSVDLTVNFYFSYSYDLTSTLQYNLTPIQVSTPEEASHNILGFRQYPRHKYMWNAFLLEPLLNATNTNNEFNKELSINCTNHDWVICIIHGFINQIKLEMGGSRPEKVDEVFNKDRRKSTLDKSLNKSTEQANRISRSLLLTMIARRSRLYAGTRFNKRGTNCQGDVANEVEIEQIVGDMTPSSLTRARMSSFVQIRGSIPLLWSQTMPSTKNLSFKAKPELRFDSLDPCYVSTGKHFMKLMSEYGSPLIVFNLVKKENQSESRLTAKFKAAIEYLNQFLPLEHRLRYYHLDMSALSKQKGDSALDKILEYSKRMVDMCGFYYTGSIRERYGEDGKVDVTELEETTVQKGIVRVNCVDCLDRTNTAQFALGLAALPQQLIALGVTTRTEFNYEMQCVRMLEEVYDAMGDTIALQYGSSQLVHRIENYRGKYHNPGTRITPTVLSISRYYNNTFSDKEKQEAINLFLGVYRPLEHHPVKFIQFDNLTNQRIQPVISQPKLRLSMARQKLQSSQSDESSSLPFSSNSLALWEMESDYSMHHIFDTSIATAISPNKAWFDDQVVKCLPYASREVMKTDSLSCVFTRIWASEKQLVEPFCLTVDNECNTYDLIDWYGSLYKPHRLTIFDSFLRLIKNFTAVDCLKLPPEQLKYPVEQEKKTPVPLTSPSNRENNIAEDVESFDFSIQSLDEPMAHYEPLKTEESFQARKKNINLVESFLQFPAFSSRASQKPEVNVRMTYSFVRFANDENVTKKSSEAASKKLSKKKSIKEINMDKIEEEKYGLLVSAPSAENEALYEKYVEMGEKSGLYSTNSPRNDGIDNSYDAPLSSLFKDNRSNFTDMNSSIRDVKLVKPNERDQDIYRSYVAMGTQGVTHVPVSSQLKYQEYLKQKYEMTS